ncbi:hypothetical protein [Metabacillus sp. RGM 3146]|uniref:hypothetical protein n=1 Tax=Metabacillus sp. RGM 3146 TaxID=3401092 RepID=UPI003B997261
MGEELHFPDLKFQQYCKEKYGVNRGIYNTIEEWLYSRGAYEILKRRKWLLLFLEFAKSRQQNEQALQLFKIGKGELIPSLEVFYKRFVKSA